MSNEEEKCNQDFPFCVENNKNYQLNENAPIIYKTKHILNNLKVNHFKPFLRFRKRQISNSKSIPFKKKRISREFS